MKKQPDKTMRESSCFLLYYSQTVTIYQSSKHAIHNSLFHLPDIAHPLSDWRTLSYLFKKEQNPPPQKITLIQSCLQSMAQFMINQ